MTRTAIRQFHNTQPDIGASGSRGDAITGAGPGGGHFRRRSRQRTTVFIGLDAPGSLALFAVLIAATRKTCWYPRRLQTY